MIKFLFTILLNVIGVCILVAVIVVPIVPQFRNDKRVDSLLGTVLCVQGERLVREPSNNPVLNRVGLAITPYCISRSGQKNDVTTRWLLIGVGGFGVTMLFGIVLDIMLALNAFRRGVVQLAIRRNTPPRFPTTPTLSPSPDIELSLSDKLKRLDEARQSGSITNDDYNRLRQDILSKL